MGKVGLTSQVGSGDLMLAFSTTYRYDRDPQQNIISPQNHFIEDDDTLNALYASAVEATEAAIYDALFSAQTMTGRDGITFYGLPRARVLQMLQQRPSQ
jgi:D-aminopeptidase